MTSKTNTALHIFENLNPRSKQIMDLLNVLPDIFMVDTAKRTLPMSEREFEAVQTQLAKALKSAAIEIESVTYKGAMEYRKSKT